MVNYKISYFLPNPLTSFIKSAFTSPAKGPWVTLAVSGGRAPVVRHGPLVPTNLPMSTAYEATPQDASPVPQLPPWETWGRGSTSSLVGLRRENSYLRRSHSASHEPKPPAVGCCPWHTPSPPSSPPTPLPLHSSLLLWKQFLQLLPGAPPCRVFITIHSLGRG